MNENSDNIGDFGEVSPRIAAARWSVSLLDALMCTEDRIQLDADFREAHTVDPDWCDTWFAGVITSTMASLPAEDPWRKLSANYIDRHGNAHHSTAPGVPAMDQTGARTRGRVFGSRRDHTDLVSPTFNDWKSDAALATVSRNIQSATAAIIGTAGRGDWRLTLELLRVIRDDYEATQGESLTVADIMASSAHSYDMAKTLFDVYRDALLFSMHRRRVYVGRDDDFSWAIMFRWITRTEQVLAGEEYSDEEFALDNDEGKIHDGDYERFHLRS